MRTRPHRPSRRGAARRLQRGISLIFALIALVILGLGAVALTRSVDTSTLIMGNLSFRQDAVVAASSGAEQAMAWLEEQQADASVLDFNITQRGYYASAMETKLDPTGNRSSSGADKPALVNWDGDCMGRDPSTYENCATVPFRGADVNGNRVQWIITRLCDSPSLPPVSPNNCFKPDAGSTGNAKDRGALKPGPRLTGGAPGPYYRIIVRVEGPRNTVSFTETLVHF